jgi:hypothetical protein
MLMNEFEPHKKLQPVMWNLPYGRRGMSHLYFTLMNSIIAVQECDATKAKLK